MKIGIIGATGKAGQKILKEALVRDHDVTAIVRTASKVKEDVSVIEKDVFELTAQDVASFDVIINAFGAPFGHEDLHVKAGRHLIEIFDGLSTRLIVVGGAGSLFTDDSKTTKVIDTPDFPEAFVPTASNQAQNLEDLQASSLNYTFVSPSAFFDAEGPRTGNYTTAEDVLIINEQGESYVSYADFAIAIVDEAENNKFAKRRFTVSSLQK